MNNAYRAIAGLISLLVVLQAAFIGLAWFTVISATDEGAVVIDESTRNAGINGHSAGAIIIALLAIVLLVISFLTPAPGAAKWGGIVFGTVLLQWVLAIFAFSIPSIGFLHGINAFAIAATAGIAASKVGAKTATTEPVSA